ncbi:MAG: 30S ribosomal protein S1, partial [Chlamydiae bacterium]|nr:30S ribosomal protein S1 [Chlamydiota bacterium]
MTKNNNFTWETENLLDDVSYQDSDAKEFRELLNTPGKERNKNPVLSPGTILRGKVVEIEKEHVVVDVGLKSEGLIPVSEFTDPEELVLDKDGGQVV